MVFDAALSIDLHLLSMDHTGERVVAGRQSGVAKAGDEITWEARHFGILQQLSVVIESVERPLYFRDRMIRGAFGSMVHHHRFEKAEEGTLMRDTFIYSVPYGLAGMIFDCLILKRYMRKLLLRRNETLVRFVCGAHSSGQPSRTPA